MSYSPVDLAYDTHGTSNSLTQKELIEKLGLIAHYAKWVSLYLKDEGLTCDALPQLDAALRDLGFL